MIKGNLGKLMRLLLLCICMITNTVQAQNNNKFVVALDAGHGGHDPGNRGNGYREKDIALKVVLEVGRQLEQDHRFKVVYTRKTDVFIELHERGKIANKAKADLFVSVHCNAHRSQASGTETFVLGLHANDENFNVAKNENSVILLEDNYKANYDGFDPNSPESIIGLILMQEEYLDQSLTLASIIEKRFTNSLKRKSRGVKQAGFVVLHQTYMPSVLVELGFLTNYKEGKYLNSKTGQMAMAKTIVSSIKDYQKSMEEMYKESEPAIENIDVADGEVLFKVQIGAGAKDIPLEPKNFNGLDAISKKQYGTIFKYYFGGTTIYKEAQELQKQAAIKGFDSSFIVAFKDGTVIPLAEALKTNTPANK